LALGARAPGPEGQRSRRAAAAARSNPLAPAPHVIRRHSPVFVSCVPAASCLLIFSPLSSSPLPPPWLPPLPSPPPQTPRKKNCSAKKPRKQKFLDEGETLAGRIPPRHCPPPPAIRDGARRAGGAPDPAGVRGSGRWRVGAGVGSVAGGSTGPDRWRRHGQAGWPPASARSAGPGPRGASGPAGRPPETAATATAAGNGRGWPSSGGSSTGSLRIGSSRSPTASMVR